ncbi:MAG: MoaA/NifB/PqqE/SkfB family radical SAM enzyme [Bradymonadia bacterium]|jgi:MoaA/NifB/PqqE/SkfB family radical SAM enzyme
MTSLTLDAIASRAISHDSNAAPLLPLRELDTLWLQVTGTVCNIACRHCFISCGPKNDSHPFMTVEQVDDALEAALRFGTREYYFTGGEPFMHPEIFGLIESTLAQGPLSILTNGILIDEDAAKRLRDIFDASPYSLDLRVSLDGTTAKENDPIRGGGTFERIIAGVKHLAAAGINPVLTVTEVGDASEASRDRFRELLRSLGLPKPRTKFLAPFRIGREERRGRGYEDFERLVDGDLLEGEDEALQCSSCRMVTAKGAYPCPILIEQEDARMGDSLDDAMKPIRLSHPACYTCHVEGVSCRT